MRFRIPYTLKLLFPTMGFAGICVFFGCVLILSIGKFEPAGSRLLFIIGIPAVLLADYIFTIFRFGNFWFSSEESKAINNALYQSDFPKKLKPEEAKNIFYSLVSFSRNIFSSTIWEGLILTILIVVIGTWRGIRIEDTLIIIGGASVATVLSAVFASFYSEQKTFFLVKALRKKLMESNETVPNINFDSIKSKFYFLFLFPIITAIIVLLCVFPFDFNVAVLSVVGITMVLIIDRVLFLYITKSFYEAEEFITDMAEGNSTVFATGSVDKELVTLIDGLNDASKRALISRKESEKAKEEMKNRVIELEKFFDLTVNREIKMVELKKQIKKEKEKNAAKKIKKGL
ncbi:MAG: hypothetical protein WC520_02835 [Candidatus Paceibacterota bacterium]